MTAASQFGGLVRSVRKSRKLKIWQVAEKVDIEVKHLGRIERGERQPSFDLIIALAKCLNVSPSKFFEFDSAADPKTLRQRQRTRNETAGKPAQQGGDEADTVADCRDLGQRKAQAKNEIGRQREGERIGGLEQDDEAQNREGKITR